MSDFVFLQFCIVYPDEDYSVVAKILATEEIWLKFYVMYFVIIVFNWSL